MGTFTNLKRKYGLSGLISFLKIKSGFTSSISLDGLSHPFQLRPNSSDVTTFKHIFAHDDYGFEFEPPIKTIIDAGANIGLASIYFANKYPEVEIICIELDPVNYGLLKVNTEKYPSIETINAGLWHNKETLKFKYEGVSHWGYKVDNDLNDGSVSVDSITMTELISRYDLQSIDILKIDIEGSEVELFSKNYESWLPKVKYLVIETHDRWRSNSTEVVRKAVAKCNFMELGQVGENLVFINNVADY